MWGRSWLLAVGAWVMVLMPIGLLLMAQTPTTPTRVSDAAVAAPATSFTAIWVVTPTGKVLVQPDATIRIDLTAVPPTIRAVIPPTPAGPSESVNQFVAVAGQTAFQLSSAPAAGWPVKVYKNGLLQWQSADYSLTGQTVTFLPAQGIAPGDYVQAVYWR